MVSFFRGVQEIGANWRRPEAPAPGNENHHEFRRRDAREYPSLGRRLIRGSFVDSPSPFNSNLGWEH